MSGGAVEMEAKFGEADFELLRRRLRESGATRLGRVIETNRFYDRADGGLQAAGCGLRLRELRVLDGSPRAATITFKGPLQAGPLKTRPECELEILDAGRAGELLALLGFSEFFCFQKCRETWRSDACLVELDEVPVIGRFVEVEGPSRESVEQVCGRLELPMARSIRASYLGLLISALRDRGEATRCVKIENAG